ncbi:unnamed protein product [Amoebophrya sp. A25]|nr:unnamed protein product [Amoebophrya sp. A25]|eukprot:GSA25T00009682001.1
MPYGQERDVTTEDVIWQKRCEREVYAQTRAVYDKYYKNAAEEPNKISFADSRDTAQELINGTSA